MDSGVAPGQYKIQIIYIFLQLLLIQLFDAQEHLTGIGIHVVKTPLCPNSSELLTQSFFVAMGHFTRTGHPHKRSCGLHVMVVARFPHAKATSVCSS